MPETALKSKTVKTTNKDILHDLIHDYEEDLEEYDDCDDGYDDEYGDRHLFSGIYLGYGPWMGKGSLLVGRGPMRGDVRHSRLGNY